MKLYLIGGLGADDRVFQYLNLDCETIPVQWIEPKKDEQISDYALRIRQQIDDSSPFGILAVSFGGVLAIELNKWVKPEINILISSITSSKNLPRYSEVVRKIGIIRWTPRILIKPPMFVMNYLFGTEHKLLLKNIISDTKPSFIKWALNVLLNWKNESEIENLISIHGTKDRLIPFRKDTVRIEDGGHFMIVDKASEISTIINNELARVTS